MDHLLPRVLSEILQDPLYKRIEYLQIDKFTFSDGDLPPDLSIGPFSCLKTISIQILTASWVESLLKVIYSTSQNLETVHFSEPLPSGFAEYLFWSRIKRLSLFSSDYKNPHGLNAITTQISGFDHVDNVPYDWPNAFTPRATWINVHYIALSCSMSYLCHLQLPRLESLNFRDTNRDRDVVPNPNPGWEYPILYPNVYSLELRIESPLWSQYSTNAFPKVTEYLFITKMADDVIISTLEAIPTVKHVQIRGSSRKDLGLELLQNLESRNGPFLCPNLETLEFGRSYERVRV